MGALAHVSKDPSILDHAKSYNGKDSVIVGNGTSLTKGCLSPNPYIHLLGLLFVPHLTKNLLSISKLTSDFPLVVIFLNDCFFLFRIVKQEE